MPRSLIVASCLLLTATLVSSQQTPDTEELTVNAQAATRPFPHYWEQMFGSGRAILSLRESYRRDLRTMKSATDIHYVRFHAIFDDEVGVYSEDAQGQPVYNWSYVDQIYDGLLENGVRPVRRNEFHATRAGRVGLRLTPSGITRYPRRQKTTRNGRHWFITSPNIWWIAMA